MFQTQKGFAPIVAILLGVFLIAGGGLLGWRAYNGQKEAEREARKDEARWQKNRELLASKRGGGENKESKKENGKAGNRRPYRNEVLGISFSYPGEWGDASVEPNNYITDLESFIEQATKNADNLYYGSLAIVFSKMPDVEIRMYDETVPGEDYPNYGRSDFSRLKESRSICDYSVSVAQGKFDKSSVAEIYNDCSGGIKTYIVKETQYFDPDKYFGSQKGPGYVYSYALAQAAFFEAQNGFYDNILIKYSPNFFSQIKETRVAPDDFFKKDFYPDKQRRQISKESYMNESGEFKDFVGSMSFFAPPERTIAPFSAPDGEDPDVTLIRRYYYHIETGNLDAAYTSLGKNAPGRPDFDSRYAKTYKARATDIKKIGDGSYQFLVDFQLQNTEPELYRVTSTVSGGKIIPASSEKITSPFVFSGNKYAFAKEEKGSRHVIVYDGKEEVEVAEDKNGKPTENTFFEKVRFSPQGNYLMYDRIAWEYFEAALYDINNRKNIDLDAPYSKLDFTPDEKYLFYCGASEVGGTFTGGVLKAPDFIFDGELCPLCALKQTGYRQIDCDYDDSRKEIRFTASDFFDTASEKIDHDKQETAIFDTKNGEVKLIEPQ